MSGELIRCFTLARHAVNFREFLRGEFSRGLTPPRTDLQLPSDPAAAASCKKA
jgi:hypothetical protein